MRLGRKRWQGMHLVWTGLLPAAGCFHFDGLMQQLHEEFRLYALDFVGQGRSWPEQPRRAWPTLWTCGAVKFATSSGLPALCRCFLAAR